MFGARSSDFNLYDCLFATSVAAELQSQCLSVFPGRKPVSRLQGTNTRKRSASGVRKQMTGSDRTAIADGTILTLTDTKRREPRVRPCWRYEGKIIVVPCREPENTRLRSERLFPSRTAACATRARSTGAFMASVRQTQPKLRSTAHNRSCASKPRPGTSGSVAYPFSTETPAGNPPITKSGLGATSCAPKANPATA